MLAVPVTGYSSIYSEKTWDLIVVERTSLTLGHMLTAPQLPAVIALPHVFGAKCRAIRQFSFAHCPSLRHRDALANAHRELGFESSRVMPVSLSATLGLIRKEPLCPELEIHEKSATR